MRGLSRGVQTDASRLRSAVPGYAEQSPLSTPEKTDQRGFTDNAGSALEPPTGEAESEEMSM